MLCFSVRSHLHQINSFVRLTSPKIYILLPERFKVHDSTDLYRISIRYFHRIQSSCLWKAHVVFVCDARCVCVWLVAGVHCSCFCWEFLEQYRMRRCTEDIFCKASVVAVLQNRFVLIRPSGQRLCALDWSMYVRFKRTYTSRPSSQFCSRCRYFD